MKHIIHVSGYSLGHHPGLTGVRDHRGDLVPTGSGDWEYVCWGDPEKGLLGRIPKALLRAYQTRSMDTAVVWSTGASRLKDFNEARYLFDVASERIGLLGFTFPDHFAGDRWFPSHATAGVRRSWLRDISMFEEKSINTSTSMDELAKLLDGSLSSDRARVLLVSSRNHLPRVVCDAERAIKVDADGTTLRPHVELDYCAADTCYAGKSIHDTQVSDLGI